MSADAGPNAAATSAPVAAAISARDWGYRYAGRSTPALDGVTFDVRPGELVLVMGASGSGKSTLLGALAGTLAPEGAHGTLDVHPATGVGLVGQDPESCIVMERVGDDLAFPLEGLALPRAQIWPRVEETRRDVRLAVPLDRATANLSGGQQQLLCLGAATVARPGLLLLDEPTANLDPEAAKAVLDAVDDLRAERACTVLVIEHRVGPWLDRADRFLLVADGELVALAPDDLREHLRRRPEVARHVWLDRPTAQWAPAGPPGPVALSARGVTHAGRLRPTDLDVRRGEVVALTGPPGSGKSTLLGILAGLHAPTAGTVEVALGDARIESDPWEWPAARVAATFGVVFQNPEHQFVTGRVRAELEHGLQLGDLSPQPRHERVDQILERLGLTHLADADPFTLSGGEQRRLSVGTALVLDPRVLLLDEPTFGQDPATWTELAGLIATHRDQGGAVVLATHDPDLIAALDARVVRLAAVPEGTASGKRRLGWSGGQEPTTGPGLRSLDPLALLGGAMILSVAALASTSPALNLALAGVSLLAALLGGLPPRRVALIAAPAVLAFLSVGLSNALLGGGVGTAAGWTAAALPATRVLAVALPGLVAAVASDPTRLADSLVARLRVPARAAYSVLAALRLLPLLADEWLVMASASRARGLGGTGVRARAGQFSSMAFRLLVAALRRAARLAVALEVRGLRSTGPRTIARTLAWRLRDTLVIVGATACLVATVLLRG